MKNRSKWRFAVDSGGTFTDVVGLDPSGTFHSLKILSRSSACDDPSIEGIRRMMGIGPEALLPEDEIQGIRFGTTVATNALLEQKGCKVALLVTEGFADLLEIGYQSRPEIFSLCIRKPDPLYSSVYEIGERIDRQGTVIRPLDENMIGAAIRQLRADNADAVAIVFMHSWINPAHELYCAEKLMEAGISTVYLSHQTVNLIKIVSRGQSTMVDAYLSTVLTRYLLGITNHTGTIPVDFMQSNGVLAGQENFTGRNAILSGPAGGVVAVAALARERDLKGVIGFDMGGTSTDVSRYEGTYEKVYERTIADIPLQAEMLDIVTVAAGGGSILNFDGQKMTAGPQSAGAVPGPACYGFGGPLTVTDANLMTGRLIPDYFPRTFGTDGTSSLNREIVKKKFSDLADEINAAMKTDLTPEQVALGFLRIANEKMALAINEISVSRGFDVRSYGLVCFGGAGGQHACSIATLLDIDTIFIHPLSSVMSAYGIGLAKRAWSMARTVLHPYTGDRHQGLVTLYEEIEGALIEKNIREHVPYTIKRELDLRPQGAESFLTVEYHSYEKTVELFNRQYRRLFGFQPETAQIEIVNVRTEIRESGEFLLPFQKKSACEPKETHRAYSDIYYPEGVRNAPVLHMESMPVLEKIQGPAFVIDNNVTLLIDPGFEAVKDDTGIISIKRLTVGKKPLHRQSSRPDPVLLEVFNNLFMSVATEMGITLQNTAFSVNIKERLDFSCAVFDAEANLVANAPHIPVHLGSMADTVRALVEDKTVSLKPGDAYVANSPYRGGSHLPDLTVICPVFSEGGEVVFFTAARGHHSDIGGTTPGSMPPSASHIDEEGVLMENLLIVRGGEFREEKLRNVLSDHTCPARNISERLHDFRAQIAACRKGMKELNRLIQHHGRETVVAYMRFIQENAEYAVQQSLGKFLKDSPVFHSAFEDCLDDGTPIRVAITITAGEHPPETVAVSIDFTGTGEAHTNDNLNAPESVVRSAVLYVMRCLINTEIPLNSGCLKPVRIVIPEGSLLKPVYPMPVASGNVETSQRIVDVLLGAFGVAAASQGTMNNLLFEVQGEHPYYETIAGGSGAMDGCPGASGVQVHMTNTRMTDPEILECRHPGVMLERFTLRRGSGGKGLFEGGSGVVREIRFLKPATVSIISERRESAPYGMQGGSGGKKGRNRFRRANGSVRELKHREVMSAERGDSIIIETPGGGGWGRISS